MARLTVYFKHKAIETYLFENRVVHIGRDESNDIKIDSLAVAPAHAAIIIKGNTGTIKQLNELFPVIINGQKTQGCPLNDKDTITIGKHEIIFNADDAPPEQEAGETLVIENNLAHQNSEGNDGHQHHASLQIMNGHNIGKVLSLKKAMTRLGSVGNGIAVISKRKDGYFITALENDKPIFINSTPLNDSYLKLQQNDILTINDISLQFFLY